MDWAKMQRDEAIRQANEKVTTGMPTPSDNLTLSFATEASADDTVASQDTVTPVIHESNVPSPFYDSDTSADELLLNSPPVKRSKMPPELQREQLAGPIDRQPNPPPEES